MAQKGRFGVCKVYFILSSSEGVLKVGSCTKPTKRGPKAHKKRFCTASESAKKGLLGWLQEVLL